MDYDASRLDELQGVGLEDLPDPLQSGPVTWIDVRGLGDGSVVQDLGERLGLHPLAISDIVHVGQRPKVDHYEGVVFIVLRMVTIGEGADLEREQVSIVLGKTFVATFQETHVDCLEPLRARIRAGRKLIRSSGPDYLASMVIDAIVDGYFPVLEHYGDELEGFEVEILEGRLHGSLAELYRMKRDLASFRRSVWPLREALVRLARDEEDNFTSASQLYLRDTLDHTMQVVEVNESYRELAASLVDVHLSMVGQRTNDIMRVLTVVSAIFIPLTFVAGIYGMNFDTSSAWNLPELGWAWGYPFFWGLCAVIAIALVLLFRRLGWMRG